VGSRVYTWKGGGAAVAYGLSVLAGVANLVVLQGITGASLGKLIMGLRVVDSQGAPCGMGRAFVRWILLIVDTICGVLGLIVAGLTHPHRRIGDMIGGTYVVGQENEGRPLVAAVYPPANQYAYPQGAPEWAPPGAQPPAPGWGTAPPPAWGTPPAEQPPVWGAPPPSAPPATWGAPPPSAPPAETQAGWAAPTAPAPAQSGWAAPTPPPPAPTPPTPPPPAPPTEPPPAPPTEPPPPAPAQETQEKQASPPSPPADGESWWNTALGGDDEPKQ
jgi:hypothetical protein